MRHYVSVGGKNKFYDGSVSSISIIESIREDPELDSSKKLTTNEALKKFGPRVVFYLNIVEQLKIYLSNVSSIFTKLRNFRIDYKLKENERLSSKAILNLSSSVAPTPSSTFKKKDDYDYEEDEVEKIKSKLYDNDDDTEFDEEELLIYEKQNVELKAELETLSDQIEVINRQVEELSQLFDEITPHILIHKEVIENIYSTNVDATNYISRGNNKIYEATKKSFDFRVMVLLFLIICSLGLLFLNWYQD
ncbi:hypothetical protein DICPUDRAFT_79512 [Dictyostelium purpureum]|uniref:t-SNARE coiled-coil homology domain-containing protein n=1 Tax=Dictyostelium purpureum TaxID=5786 RepID=F0ZMT6_DICPU|nr:uncharacterized protein DICPUDRAFT_79512 [Dictyostelium purpureum]EGC34740.1 hypothetical protein DICPUDRAFT_79512 [Dictyostelium purpureum]|eukprot:XP_003288740.1 hypothetical protein DICPUDRAFT_79512 [Dictyostelium purpureum]